MRVVGIVGSLREASLNKKLLDVAQKIILQSSKHEFDRIDLKPLALPVFDEDIEVRQFPDSVREISHRISLAQAIVICSPEYNGSISSPLKNMLDWVSRTKPQPFFRKKVLLMAASPGNLGGMRGLQHGRVPLDTLGAFVFPEYYSLPQAHLSFEATGELKDNQRREKMIQLLNEFLS